MTPDDVRKIIEDEVGYAVVQMHQHGDKIETLERHLEELRGALAHVSNALAVLAETIGLPKGGEFDQSRDAADQLVRDADGF